jgi:hypothetical protein
MRNNVAVSFGVYQFIQYVERLWSCCIVFCIAKYTPHLAAPMCVRVYNFFLIRRVTMELLLLLCSLLCKGNIVTALAAGTVTTRLGAFIPPVESVAGTQQCVM